MEKKKEVPGLSSAERRKALAALPEIYARGGNIMAVSVLPDHMLCVIGEWNNSKGKGVDPAAWVRDKRSQTLIYESNELLKARKLLEPAQLAAGKVIAELNNLEIRKEQSCKNFLNSNGTNIVSIKIGRKYDENIKRALSFLLAAYHKINQINSVYQARVKKTRSTSLRKIYAYLSGFDGENRPDMAPIEEEFSQPPSPITDEAIVRVVEKYALLSISDSEGPDKDPDPDGSTPEGAEAEAEQEDIAAEEAESVMTEEPDAAEDNETEEEEGNYDNQP